MKSIYVEDMFLLNLVVNYFILLATARLCALPLRRWRFAGSAALGAAYSVCLLFPPLQFLASPVMKLVLGFVMAMAAFGAQKGLLRSFPAFLAVSAAFGGAVYASSLLAGQSLGEGLYINVSMRVLALSFAVCYLVLTLVFQRLAARRARTLHAVRLTLRGRTAEFSALRDTGNALYDPMSNLPVMVVGIEQASRLLPENLLAPLKSGVTEFIRALGEEEAYRTRFRLVPYSAVGVSAALLPVFRPDGLWLDGIEEKNLLVGLCPTKLSGDGEFSAVI
jgi:stage II sporulation protein GA (sporulation sigma-E factor processing peptidase)